LESGFCCIEVDLTEPKADSPDVAPRRGGRAGRVRVEVLPEVESRCAQVVFDAARAIPARERAAIRIDRVPRPLDLVVLAEAFVPDVHARLKVDLTPACAGARKDDGAGEAA